MRTRRTKTDIDNLLNEVHRILKEQDEPITIRHLFYRLVGCDCIKKTEKEYHNLCNQLTKWRRDLLIPYSAFVDTSRTTLGTTGFDDIRDLLNVAKQSFTLNKWNNQDCYIENWVEKDAISAIINDVASDYGVKTLVCRGFTSISSLYQSSLNFNDKIQQGKKVIIQYYGDYDASGLLMDKSYGTSLLNDFNVNVDIQRVAVREEHIQQYNLPTRPGKESNHSKKFTGDSVEIDALENSVLKGMVKDNIEKHINFDEWNKMCEIENEEKNKLNQFIDTFKEREL